MGNFFNSQKSRGPWPPWFHRLCVLFPVILFHSKSTSNRYNLNVKYRIGYRYRQISVIKNRNIGISVFSHIGASLFLNIKNFLCDIWNLPHHEKLYSIDLLVNTASNIFIRRCVVNGSNAMATHL